MQLKIFDQFDGQELGPSLGMKPERENELIERLCNIGQQLNHRVSDLSFYYQQIAEYANDIQEYTFMMHCFIFSLADKGTLI